MCVPWAGSSGLTAQAQLMVISTQSGRLLSNIVPQVDVCANTIKLIGNEVKLAVKMRFIKFT